MKMKFRVALRTTLVLIVWLGSPELLSIAWADLVVIGNSGNAVELTAEQVAKIFLGKTRQLPNGQPVKPLDQNDGMARQEFLEKILHKTESSLRSYWSRLVFTGNGAPPDTVDGDEAVKKSVFLNPHSVGYIQNTSLDPSVRVLFRVP